VYVSWETRAIGPLRVVAAGRYLVYTVFLCGADAVDQTGNERARALPSFNKLKEKRHGDIGN